ncbi:hypothetical protein HUJ04_009361 [Dendroctonus ponderosae]|nr:hypothetical protein HUJ04_009361 [Dendroctonus ponderosae]
MFTTQGCRVVHQKNSGWLAKAPTKCIYPLSINNHREHIQEVFGKESRWSAPEASLNNPQQRSARDKSSFLRFGRSISEGSKKKRDKRQAAASADALKRHENYLRFGRTASSNFMRFGRNLGAQGGLSEEELIRPSLESRNRHLLDYLKSLLRQSDGRISHLN